MIHDFSRLNVLLASADAQARPLIATLLRAGGVEKLEVCGDGQDALDVLTRKSIDILVVDWELGLIGGLELVRRLRNEESSPSPTVQIVMFTAYTERHNIEAARDAGVSELLAKPVSSDALFKRIANILVNPRGFVRVGSYFGPDRRRNLAEFMGQDRRASAPEIVETESIEERQSASRQVMETIAKRQQAERQAPGNTKLR
ncbi:MAG: response regulator [Alphaproteobacteria bacterium]